VLLDRSPLGILRYPARLAFLRHAASVRPEPGSNSPSDSWWSYPNSSLIASCSQCSVTRRLLAAHFPLLAVHITEGSFRTPSKVGSQTAIRSPSSPLDALLAVQFSRIIGLAGRPHSVDKPNLTTLPGTVSTPFFGRTAITLSLNEGEGRCCEPQDHRARRGCSSNRILVSDWRLIVNEPSPVAVSPSGAFLSAALSYHD
jgi:hypothetical protein